MTGATNRWQFWIDVGGTFTDCIARDPQGVVHTHKTLSSGVIKGSARYDGQLGAWVDNLRQFDPPDIWRGYSIAFPGSDRQTVTLQGSSDARLFVDQPGEETPGRPRRYELSSNEPAPLVAIRYLLGLPLDADLPPMDVRLGTTRGTNALLTRTGAQTALVTTRGFGDLWEIGYQSRPDLFCLDVRKPSQLYGQVIEVDERTSADGALLTRLDSRRARANLEQVRRAGFDALAICLLHANANPQHENELVAIAGELGFPHVSVSHEVASLRKAVPRGDTTILDAYLTPVLADYLHRIESALHADSELQVMTSAGGLTTAGDFRGKDSILSGPAGGVVGVGTVAEATNTPTAIGFDMGGTSTDVSRWSGNLELEFETEKTGVRIATPMMAIQTVAAGGGSVCRFDGVKLVVGPESAGAHPGPACYGNAGPLTVTDVNLFLGRLLPEAFPFPLDRAAVGRHLETQCAEIAEVTGQAYTPETLAEGYRKIANTNMAEAIRCVTIERGTDPRDDALIAFGGAAAQHACAVADELGIQRIVVHPFAGILSALGIGNARLTTHHEVGVYRPLKDVPSWHDLFETLRERAREDVPSSVELTLAESLDIRFVGMDEPINVPRPSNDDFFTAFCQLFRQRHGYLPRSKRAEAVTARLVAQHPSAAIAAVGTIDTKGHALPSTVDIWSQGKKRSAQVTSRASLRAGDGLEGPALLTDALSTTLVDPGWRATVRPGGELQMERYQTDDGSPNAPDPTTADPVLLEVFHRRFEAIATQMGSTLRRTARSVNIKERLDYSCAIFAADGSLVVNAPHIPVHLGAMGETVRWILDHETLAAGDVWVTNDPYRGGSHLPDVTVITPVYDPSGEHLRFLTASRAHHAEIGGSTPGSMPPFSRHLAEEGVLLPPMKVASAGDWTMENVEALLRGGSYPSRDPETNVADLRAQVAANQKGVEELQRFVDEYGWPLVAAYMQHIQTAAEQKLRTALSGLPSGTRCFEDHLDDGSRIAVRLDVQGEQATLDFTGTAPVAAGNLNANVAIVTAAVMYCLRCLINEDIPLNQGVLKPIQIVLPECLLNPPAGATPEQSPAMVGGNVETSQRVVDVVLGALGLAAASQGTMNNFLFGNGQFGYYETICGGVGATPSGPGASAVHSHMTNTRLTDPEVLEARFPVRLRQFSIRPDSGGAGQHAGGNGVCREIEFLAPLQISLLTQRRGHYAPYGCAGGDSGHIGRNTLLRDGIPRDLSSQISIPVLPGDVLRIETPGGGGWGTA